VKIIQLPIPDAFIIEIVTSSDDRGMFSRIFCQKELNSILHGEKIVQVNHSFTKHRGMIRGMHFQVPPKAEIKIVKCIRGSVFDVIIDLRKGSSTFLKWFGEILSEDNMKMIYVPQGFAHGFQTQVQNTELLYFHTEFYSPRHERGIRYDDPMIGVSWPLTVSGLSDRDKTHPLLTEDFRGLDS
jgi:dTDP-4-dehydrorhamnose 3,5-epimerase